MTLTLGQLESVFQNCSEAGNGFVVSCPLHDDNKASLSITSDDEKGVLVKCFAGCEQNSVYAAVCEKLGVVKNVQPKEKFKANRASADKLAAEFLKNAQAMAYVAGRGISIEVATKLNFGYAEWLFDDGRKPALVIPHYVGGKLVGMIARPIQGLKEFKQEPGSSIDGLYAAEHLDKTSTNVLVFEGGLDAALVISHGFNATAIISTSSKVSAQDIATLNEYKHIFIIGDQDAAGQKAMDKLQARLNPERVVRVRLPAKDVGELWKSYPENFASVFRQKCSTPSLKIVDVTEFVKMTLTPRPMLLEPFLQEKSIGMIHAWRGVGKTHVMLGIAAAIASGGMFLKWRATKPSPVLYVDGEMADDDIQLWLKEALRTEGIPAIDPGYFQLIASDLQETEIPSLLTREGQNLIEDRIKEVNPKLVIFDNISSLFRGGSEKEDQDWNMAQDWLLSLRRRGIATLLGHHDGKQRIQRGTSKREDPMNWVIHLKHPADYTQDQGLRAEVHFEKARRLFGADARPFEVQLMERNGEPVWAMKELEEAMAAMVHTMHDEQGMSFRDIATELGKSKSTIQRIYEKAAPRPATVPFEESLFGAEIAVPQ